MSTVYSADELQEGCKMLEWEEFERRIDGNIHFWQGPTYYMRVGLHLGRPFQVLISNGQFVKMRPVEALFPKHFYDLKVLSQEKPNDCLYGPPGYEGWRPPARSAGVSGQMMTSTHIDMVQATRVQTATQIALDTARIKRDINDALYKDMADAICKGGKSTKESWWAVWLGW